MSTQTAPEKKDKKTIDKKRRRDKEKKKPRYADKAVYRDPSGNKFCLYRERIPFDCAACGEEVDPSKGYYSCTCEKEFCLACHPCEDCGRCKWMQRSPTLAEKRRGPAPWVVL